MRGDRSLSALLCALGIAFAGCGGGDATRSDATAPPPTASTPPPATTAAAEAPPAAPKLAPNPWREPGNIAPHPHPAAERVLVHDVRRGKGPVVHPYDTVMVDYIQALWASGRKFFMGWKDGPYPTEQMVLAPFEERRGLVRGMAGMRVGGRRQITAPPRLTGIETKHDIFRRHVYWDVVVRALVARGERPSDASRGLAPNPWREPAAIPPHPHARVDRVVVRELAKGHGPGVFANASLLADFIEANYRTGGKLYRAWGDEPYAPENLEAAAMMKGFQIGVEGMRAGARRQIIVPPRLSDLDDPDRRGPTYRQPVYFDVVLRSVRNPVIPDE